MFNGIIYDRGIVKNIINKNNIKTIKVYLEKKEIQKYEKGMSIAVNGVCLTATDISKNNFIADISKETLEKTNLKNIKYNSKVNIELPITIETFLSGHIVQGHVDTTGKILKIIKQNKNIVIEIGYKNKYNKYIVEKGSIAVDGVSLTTYNVKKDRFNVSIIPETYENTIIKDYKINTIVNLEFDILGKYIEKFIKKEE